MLAKKLEPLYVAVGDVKMWQLLWKRVQCFLKMLNMKLPFDSAIPLLGAGSRKTANRDLTRYHVSWATWGCIIIAYQSALLKESLLRLPPAHLAWRAAEIRAAGKKKTHQKAFHVYADVMRQSHLRNTKFGSNPGSHLVMPRHTGNILNTKRGWIRFFSFQSHCQDKDK